MRRKSGYIAWFIVVIAIVALLLTWQYTGYRSASRTLPAGMTMAGMPVEGMTQEEAINALEVAFATPIEIVYVEQRLSLSPDSVELRFDTEKTASHLNTALETRSGLDGFVAHVLRRPPVAVDVPVAVGYSSERIDGFLARIGAQYDHPSQSPVPITSSLTFRPGRPGYQLDVEASRALLAAALVSVTEHQVELVVQTEEAPPLNSSVLGQMIESLLDGHEGLIPGLFIKDLETGDELEINADVAYDGLSVLKIAILEETYRVVDLPLDPQIADWLSDTMGVTDDSYKADLLLGNVIGTGDSSLGAYNLNTSMKRLGLVNTFIAAPYGAEAIPLTVATPANSRTDITTAPGPHMQTTPLDMGLLLEMIYQCSQGGGALMVAYPDAFSIDECNQMVEWMSLNRIDSLIETGVPVGTKVAHKQGIAGDIHADAGLVYGPGDDFVLVAFLHRPEWLTWEESAPLISDIAKATYNYFNLAH